MKKTLMIFAALLAINVLVACVATRPPIIITGPMGIQANNDAYKTVRIRNVGPVYWRFWLSNNQQIVLYPGRTLFVKPTSDFWNRCQGFWAHAYLEVNQDGRVKESTFAGEQWVQSCSTGYTWVCDTGQVIGGDIALGGASYPQYPFPVHFSYSVPLLPIGIQAVIH